MKTFVSLARCSRIFVPIVLSLVLFVACGKDEKETEPQTNTQSAVNNAVGTWMCVSSVDTYDGSSHSGLMVGAQITIKADGTYTSTSSSFGREGTYVVNATSFTARSSTGDTFVLTINVMNDKMTWQGTSSTGVTFSYTFTRE